MITFNRAARDFWKGYQRILAFDELEEERVARDVERQQEAITRARAELAVPVQVTPTDGTRTLRIAGWLILSASSVGCLVGGLATPWLANYSFGTLPIMIVWCFLPQAIAGAAALLLFSYLEQRKNLAAAKADHQRRIEAAIPKVPPARSIYEPWSERVIGCGWQGRAATTGAPGERHLFEYLYKQLGNDFYCLSGLSLLPRSDMDIVLIGPSGVTVLDSKYWADVVAFENEEWIRLRRGNASGSQDWVRERVASPLEVQLTRECLQVAGAISDGLGWRYEEVCECVQGILVFTHPRVELHRPHIFPASTEIISSALITRITGQITGRSFTPEERLAIGETLCNRDLEPPEPRFSALELAVELESGLRYGS